MMSIAITHKPFLNNLKKEKKTLHNKFPVLQHNLKANEVTHDIQGITCKN